jgi:hypothetical protein
MNKDETEMQSLDSMLVEEGFDFDTGVVIVQKVDDTGQTLPAQAVERASFVMQHLFYTGYGGNNCPRFWAKDKDYIYFCGTYDGSSWIDKVAINPAKYFSGEEIIPVVGGG